MEQARSSRPLVVFIVHKKDEKVKVEIKAGEGAHEPEANKKRGVPRKAALRVVLQTIIVALVAGGSRPTKIRKNGIIKRA